MAYIILVKDDEVFTEKQGFEVLKQALEYYSHQIRLHGEDRVKLAEELSVYVAVSVRYGDVSLP